jgi:glycine cleavage system H protein
MRIMEYEIPDELYYHKEHTWVRMGEPAEVGVTDFAAKEAGEIKRIVLPTEGDEIVQDRPFGTISSGKWTGKIYAPISGEVVSVNEEVEDDPKLINDDPYGKGWCIKVKAADMSEMEKLMKVSDMPAYIEARKREIEAAKKG